LSIILKMNAPAPLPDGARRLALEEPALRLADLAPGSRAVVRSVEDRNGLRRRLLELGFVSGTEVRVVRVAPLADPIEVELHGYHLSLRRSEAGTVLVRPA
jgi:Fe2+ transport system protein FeoA